MDPFVLLPVTIPPLGFGDFDLSKRTLPLEVESLE